MWASARRSWQGGDRLQASTTLVNNRNQFFFYTFKRIILAETDVESKLEDEESRNLNQDNIQTEQETVETRAPSKSLRDQLREKSWFGKKCVKIFRVFSNTFGMTFLAEWGDRSVLHTFKWF